MNFDTSSEEEEEEYWNGPYGILIPIHRVTVISPSGDIISKNGENTIEFKKWNFNESEYKEKFCIKKDNNYYWDQEKCSNYIKFKGEDIQEIEYSNFKKFVLCCCPWYLVSLFCI